MDNALVGKTVHKTKNHRVSPNGETTRLCSGGGSGYRGRKKKQWKKRGWERGERSGARERPTGRRKEKKLNRGVSNDPRGWDATKAWVHPLEEQSTGGEHARTGLELNGIRKLRCGGGWWGWLEVGGRTACRGGGGGGGWGGGKSGLRVGGGWGCWW